MDEPIRKKDIQNLNERIKQLESSLREIFVEITNKIDATGSNIISAIFSESKNIREEIGHHTIMLKMLEDNLNSLQFDENIGISSKIEVSVGGEVFGTGAKWVWDIDLGKRSQEDALRALQSTPGIANDVMERAISKLRKLLGNS